jgi:hypothetical protein
MQLTVLFIVNALGSFELRAGFATASTSTEPTLGFESVVSKFKERKKNTSFMLAGSDCFSDTQSRSAIKSPFDGDVVTNMEIMVGVVKVRTYGHRQNANSQLFFEQPRRIF